MAVFHRRPDWSLGRTAEQQVTPPDVWSDRRRLMRAAAAGAIGAAAWALTKAPAQAAVPAAEPLSAPVFTHSPLSGLASPDGQKDSLTPKESVVSYNNFYEFGVEKEDPAAHSAGLRLRPWTIRVDGLCEKPGTLDIESLLRFPLEERIYRLRCVEAWSMVIPWVGVPLADVLARFAPLSSAKFVRFETLYDPAQMPGQRRSVLHWPYVEGLRIDEAAHPLTLLAVGLYGSLLLPQSGAPVRLVVPWKYGFKSIKSIVRIEFTDQMPRTSWATMGPNEYGFYANVNPAVDHPRWSQQKERRLGEFLRRPTVAFNGYGEQVAGLYRGQNLTVDF